MKLYKSVDFLGLALGFSIALLFSRLLTFMPGATVINGLALVRFNFDEQSISLIDMGLSLLLLLLLIFALLISFPSDGLVKLGAILVYPFCMFINILFMLLFLEISSSNSFEISSSISFMMLFSLILTIILVFILSKKSRKISKKIASETKLQNIAYSCLLAFIATFGMFRYLFSL